MDISTVTEVQVFIEHESAREGELVELRMPFIPREGEILSWSQDGERIYGEVVGLSWVFHEPDPAGISKLKHVNLVTKELEDSLL